MVRCVCIKESEYESILLLLLGTTNVKFIKPPTDSFADIQIDNVIYIDN
jgi:hypothetical protein